MFEFHIIGATGLTGQHLVKNLIKVSGAKVFVHSRSAPQVTSPSLIWKELKRNPDGSADFSQSVDGSSSARKIAISCLGTTIKTAGSREAFYAIDYTLNLSFAKAMFAQGVLEFHLLSSVGANAKASNFYLQVKGELEESLSQIGFITLCIYQPSLLVGARTESRPFERLMQKISPAFSLVTEIPGLGSYKPINAALLADKMAACSQRSLTGVLRFSGHSLFNL